MPETAASPSSSTRNRPSKQYRCSLCDKPFDSAETLDSHQRFEHSEPGHSKPVAGVGWHKLRQLYGLVKYANSICYGQCDLGMESEQEAIKKLKNVPGVIDVNGVNGVYDIVIKITSDTLDSLKETITRDIRTIDVVKSTMTLIMIE